MSVGQDHQPYKESQPPKIYPGQPEFDSPSSVFCFGPDFFSGVAFIFHFISLSLSMYHLIDTELSICHIIFEPDP